MDEQHQKTLIESVLFIKSKLKSEKSRTSSTTTTTIKTTTTTSSYSTSRLNSKFEDDQNSVIRRPIRHDINNRCFCYENAEDCTTCTDESDVFMLTSSESRSQAGSSSSFEDGPSLETCSVEADESSEIPEDVIRSEVSALEARDIDAHIESLKTKKVEFHEEFLKNSTIFGQLMTLHGFQRAVLNDRLINANNLISKMKTEQAQQMDSTTEITEFNELDIAQLLLEDCHVAHSEVRKCYLKRLMDEDIMKSNMARIEEITRQLERLKVATSSEENSEELDKILDDVSTCQSFCPDDV